MTSEERSELAALHALNLLEGDEAKLASELESTDPEFAAEVAYFSNEAKDFANQSLPVTPSDLLRKRVLSLSNSIRYRPESLSNGPESGDSNPFIRAPSLERGHAIREQPTGEDSLGIAPYAKATALFASHDNTMTPLTISIEGNWGSGKTSFLLQVRENLQSQFTVWFNPWRHEAGEALWAAFLVEFVEQIERKMRFGPRQLARIKFFFKGLGSRASRHFWIFFGSLGCATAYFYFRKYLIHQLDWSWSAVGNIVYFAPLLWAVYKLWKRLNESIHDEVSKAWKKDRKSVV